MSKATTSRPPIAKRDATGRRHFSAINALEDVFKLLKRKELGIKTNGEYITHFRFADDIMVMAESLEKLTVMLGNLNRASNS